VSERVLPPAPSPELDQLRRLTEVGRALTYTTSLDQVAKVVVMRGAALLDASASVLMLADLGGTLRLRAAHGIGGALLAGAGDDPDDLAGDLPALLGVPEDRVLAVPLVVGGAVTGLLALGLARPGTAADEWLLSALADQAAVALEHARLGGEVQPKLEDRLRASEGATDAKDRALATLAHDIRSPIGAIDGYCSNMEDEMYGSVTDEQRRVLGRVRMSGQHLLSLLDSVMEMARLVTGTVAMSREPVRLSDVAREALEIVTPAAAAKLQRLEQSGDADVVATGDRARIRQVLVNLLGNAVKFTPEEGVVTVHTSRRVSGDRSWGEVRVSDTGPGIPEPERAAIFEAYYRSPGTARAPGIGLGLAISSTLVARMGGEITVESQLGLGSSFCVRLPVSPSPVAFSSP